MGTKIGGIALMDNEKFGNDSFSYLLIQNAVSFKLIVHVLNHYNRDYDILDEPLGIDHWLVMKMN